MDQFSRHIYRNNRKAYKNDPKVLLFMEMALDRYLNQFSAIEKMFVLMPYQHCENRNVKVRSLYFKQSCEK